MTGVSPLATLLAGVLAAVLLTVAVGIGYVVNRDAAARGVEDPGRFLVSAGAVLLPVVVVPAYALYTRRLGERRMPATRTELTVAWLSVTLVAAVIVGSIVTPPDPVTQLWYVAALAVFFGVLGVIPLFRRGAFDPD